MEVYLENLAAYLVAAIIIGGALLYHLNKSRKKTRSTKEKIKTAKETGLYEPVSLHPVVDPDICIGSTACMEACPEKDILGLVHGQAQTVNASRCVGHGACFHACPVQAITLCIGTEKRGVELPHVSPEFESSVSGLYIAGELGGMGLIKNAVEQGRQACEYLTKKLKRSAKAELDLVIVGAGPAGISASLTARKNKLKFITLEQDSLGGTVYNFPRAKIVMTSPMELPLYGKIKLNETNKAQLLSLWKEVLELNEISINENEKVETVSKSADHFIVKTSKASYTSSAVLLAIGRRGSPRKLGVKGEELEKVSYRLLEPEMIHDKRVLVVGGGDSAIESAMLLADENNFVTISYRSDSFYRCKPKNLERIEQAAASGKVEVIFNSNVTEICEDSVHLMKTDTDEKIDIPNDLVYIFAGGVLPTKFLENIGISITKKFGDPIMKHD